MTTLQTSNGITFPVDDVPPATTALPQCKAHEAVRRTLGSDVESCSDYHGSVVDAVRYHPLLAAVYTAYAQHRPLVLTPDAVWLTIAQAVAHHMAVHGERLRSRFVSHQGRLDLVYEARGWANHSPENPWPDAFESWANDIRAHVGPDVYPVLACDFGTSGPVERAAGHVVMMDVFRRYFHYVALCVCGIPFVTLEGAAADWQRLLEKAKALRVFDFDWWLDRLLPVCAQFARAARGDVDAEHWRRICKLREEYGGDLINGWVTALFPYVREFPGGGCNRVNPIFGGGDGITTSMAPSGLSRVPFTWRDAVTGERRPMEAVAGLVGMTQDANTLALRPKVGWAVREAEPLDVLLARVSSEHATRPGAQVTHRSRDAWPRETWLPEDMAKFYDHTDGAGFKGRDDKVLARIVPLAQVEPVEWGEVVGRGSKGPGGHTWHRFAVFADGSSLLVNLDPNRRRPEGWEWRRPFNPVCHCGRSTRGIPGRNPVVALTFEEVLGRLIEGGGGTEWLPDAASKGYGDAEQYTRRYDE